MRDVKSFSNKTPKTVGLSMLIAICLIAIYTRTAHSSEAEDTTNSTVTPSQVEASTTDSPRSQYEARDSDDTPTASSAPETSIATPSSPSQQNTAATTPAFKNGTYTKTASYSVPHEKNTITVTLTVKDGVVSQVFDEHDYADRESTRYVDRFENAISAAVVGKKLDNISLSRVGGASLTTRGFMSALSAIVSDAKS